MQQLGGRCVFASEIDEYAIETYRENFGMDSNINIRNARAEDIPAHDVLCAGFPCQTFSKRFLFQGRSNMVRPTIVRRRNRFSFLGACLSRHGRRGSRRQTQMQIPSRLKSLKCSI